MKGLILIAAVLAANLMAIALYGMTLPVEHVASRRARFAQTPQALFAVLAGPPDWRPEVKRYEALPPSKMGREQWKEYDSRGRGILYELVENAPPMRRSIRIADETLPFGGTWTYEIIPIRGGSLLRVTEHGEIRNPLFRFVAKYVTGQTRTIEQFLTNLGRKFNQPVEIEDERKPVWDKPPSATPS